MRTPQPLLTIAHVVFSSRIAGGERHCIDLARAQAALGHRVHLIGSRGSALGAELDGELPFHGLALPFLLRGARLRQLVGELGADICHGHLGPACKATAAVRGALRLGTLHVGYKAHHHARLDGLVCVNRAQLGQMDGYSGPSRLIYNWAPELPPRSGRASSDLRAELGLVPAQLLVGAVGRLHPSKGMDLLLRAFKAHAPQHAVLALLGEGKQMDALQRLRDGDGRIHLLGYRSDVDALLPSLDLFVSPSREEAFPLAILEAMRAGLPIISTATQGPQEMLAGQPATLVPVGDVQALGRALAAQLALPAGPGRRRLSYDTSAYQREEAVQRVLGFYRELLARQGVMDPNGERGRREPERETGHGALHV